MVSGSSDRGRKRKKSAPPSRVRYEKANPAVTVRVSAELRERLAELKEVHELSLGDVLRIGVGKAKPDLDAAFKRGEFEGYEAGFHEGYDGAKEDYEVTYWCSQCRRRHMTINSDKEKEAAAKLMYQAGWYSTTCS